MSTLATVFGYGLLSARAAASVAGRFYYATDTTFMYRDNGSTWDTLSVGAGSMATDGLWDAKGDLAAGTGANTGAKLTAGSNGMVPIYDSSQSQGLKTGYPPGYEFDYAALTSTITITGTAEGSETTILASNSVTYDGGLVMVEMYTPRFEIAPSAAGRLITCYLYLDSTDLGIVGHFGPGNLITANELGAGTLKWRGTPSAGAHTFTWKAIKSNASDTAQIRGAAGGTGAYVAGFIRVTKV